MPPPGQTPTSGARPRRLTSRIGPRWQGRGAEPAPRGRVLANEEAGRLSPPPGRQRCRPPSDPAASENPRRGTRRCGGYRPWTTSTPRDAPAPPVGYGLLLVDVRLLDRAAEGLHQRLGLLAVEVGPLAEDEDGAAGGAEAADCTSVGDVEAEELDVVAHGVVAVD